MTHNPHELAYTHEDVIAVINAVRGLHSAMGQICTRGGCMRFCQLMSIIFPESEVLYDGGHAAIKICGRLYDINGQIFEGVSKFEPIDLAVMARSYRWREFDIAEGSNSIL